MATNIRANILQKQRLMRLNAHSHYVFYQKTLKDGDMKVTWMQYEGLLVQRLNRIKCINSNFSEVLSSLIVLGLETLAIINTTKECICLRFLHLTTIIRYIFSHHKHYEKWYMFQFERIVRVNLKYLYKNIFCKNILTKHGK